MILDATRRKAVLTVAGGLVAAGSRAHADGLSEAAVTPFRVAVPQREIDELKLRLRLTRLPSRETAPGWTQGVPLDQATALLAYWRDRYDWRRFEAKINAIPQFRTRIDGLGIHFLHVRSRHAGALPIILTHGWPGSVVEFLDVIGPLTDPTAHGGRAEDAFHVVVPSQPGFGWSDKPAGPGRYNTPRAWSTLMARLGYTRWVAQGGDWGSGVTHALAATHAPGLVAAHVNLPFVFPDKDPEQPTPEEKAALDARERFNDEGYGYFHEMGTRPQTIAYALADSPAGLAMWIYEKFQAWSDDRGRPGGALTADQVLDDISTYWFTNTGPSSTRIYWESWPHGPLDWSGPHIDLPMAVTVFPKEFFRAPRAWAEAKYSRLIYFNEAERGGHFAAFEQPAIFVDELRRAFRTMRA